MLDLVFSQNINELFDNGNEFYSQNNYKEAISNYEKILENGFFSEDLFLNLGNAYFQESNFGQARWSYEMGLKLNPMNTDLQNNSNINKLYIEGFIELPKNDLIDLTNIFFQSFSLNQFLLINSLLILLCALSFFVMRITQMKIHISFFYFTVMMKNPLIITFLFNLAIGDTSFTLFPPG